MKKRCLNCSERTVAKLGIVIPGVPDWLVECRPCQSKPGPYQIITELEAVALGARRHYLRTLPVKLRRLTTKERKGSKKYRYKGKYCREYLRSSINLPAVAQVQSNKQHLVKLYRGSVHDKKGLGKVLNIATRVNKSRSRLLDVAKRVLELPRVSDQEAKSFFTYYDKLCQINRQAEGELASLGLRGQAGKIARVLWKPKDKKLTWVEEVEDENLPTTLAEYVEHLQRFSGRKKGKKRKREEGVAPEPQVKTEEDAERPTKKMRQAKIKSETSCVAPDCYATKRGRCPFNMCGAHCLGCSGGHKAKVKAEPNDSAGPAQAADAPAVRKRVVMEEEAEEKPRVKAEPVEPGDTQLAGSDGLPQRADAKPNISEAQTQPVRAMAPSAVTVSQRQEAAINSESEAMQVDSRPVETHPNIPKVIGHGRRMIPEIVVWVKGQGISSSAG